MSLIPKFILNFFFSQEIENTRKLSFDTTYSHDNIYDWLQKILTDWTIIIPGASCLTFALSDWPAIGITRNVVKEWLEEKNNHKSDDLIDGACKPLAYYLSSSISQLNLSSIIELSEDHESRCLTSISRETQNSVLGIKKIYLIPFRYQVYYSRTTMVYFIRYIIPIIQLAKIIIGIIQANILVGIICLISKGIPNGVDEPDQSI